MCCLDGGKGNVCFMLLSVFGDRNCVIFSFKQMYNRMQRALKDFK